MLGSKRSRKCQCRANDSIYPSRPAPVSEACRPATGLTTLAQAAALCCSTQLTPSPATATVGSAAQPDNPDHRSHKHTKPNCEPVERTPDLSLVLPPIFFEEAAVSVPTFATMSMPPMSTITSLAGSGCSCGLECACPGCVEHRGPEHVDRDRPGCADGCGTCVDARAGLALPGYGYEAPRASGIVDKFFVRAAAPPAPPTAGQRNLLLPAGLVRVPNLRCCGGRCGCPDELCICGKSCNGCGSGTGRAALGVFLARKNVVARPRERFTSFICLPVYGLRPG
ncbi:hypothetical protein GGX14DRAFT_577835 [Mycena pura]|uniref:Metallothionein n=1 Tax=Mycena pura TaxID=153505 RepID=A0AAD6XYL5_9AGAR|nr:hypothetical protein GGX14DRAFT_577835 [Mycena pura]